MKQHPDIEAKLQDCLDKIAQQNLSIDEVLQQYAQDAQELRPLLEAALWLEARQHLFDLAPERITIQKERLLRQIERELPKSKALPLHRVGLFRQKVVIQFIALILIIVLLLSGIGGGVAFAAQSSLPGEVFYPIKTRLEDIRLATASDSLQRSQLLLEFSRIRLQESEQLIQLGRVDKVQISLGLYQQELERLIQEMDIQKNRPASIETAQAMQVIQKNLPKMHCR
ncbi:MAG: DUF5667 domain-containing protein [Anaerolineales bacterium]